jgi:hypothetical protein
VIMVGFQTPKTDLRIPSSRPRLKKFMMPTSDDSCQVIIFRLLYLTTFRWLSGSCLVDRRLNAWLE